MKTLLLCLFFTISLHVSAQKGQPGFGKVDKADLEMKDCDFDKGADAMVLIDFGSTYYDRGTAGYSLFKTIFERRTRIKILKEKGMSQADVEIPFYTHNNEERIIKLNARTYNLDEAGKIQSTDVKKSSIYSKRIDADYSKMVITFPEVKVGSIIEYSYSIERETMGSLRNWYFQGNIPIRYSEYQLKIPQLFRFTVQPSVVDPIEDKQVVTTESISMNDGYLETQVLKSNYIMRNLPGIKSEPFMGSAKDYMQRLEFQLNQIYFNENRVIDVTVKWEDVIKNLLTNDDFGLQLKKNVPQAAALIAEAKQIADAETRMKFIYQTLRKAVSWNQDDNIYTDNGIVKTWETKTGNTADINLLLINLLTEAGLKVTPMLLSTRDHGLVSPYFPFITQFNTVMGFVVINDKTFLLDATDRTINYRLIPEPVANTSGLILEGTKGKWKDMLVGKSKYKVMAAVQADIDAEGTMKGNCLVNCYDYARAQRCELLIKNPAKFKDDFFISPYPAVKIQDIVINNADTDSLPLEQKIKFTSALSSSGDYKYFSVNLFSDLERNPFIADKRLSDVDFGVQQDYTLFGNYTIPAGFSFDGIPENISLSTSDNSIIFTRSMKAESNLLNVRMTLQFKRSFYPASNYTDFKEFYKKLFDKLNEQVVIKKTAP